MTSFTGYSLAQYGRMVTDTVRFEAYARALRQVVTPESVVADIGAGPGIFTLLAAQMGAAAIHACDPVDVSELAWVFAIANGFEDKVQVHRCLSTELDLSPRADVIVSDLRGITPMLQHHIAAIVDARARLLAPDGMLIPRRDRLQVALLSHPEQYAEYVAPWSEDWHGLKLDAGREYVVNTPCQVRATGSQLCSEPATWAVLDYYTVTSPNVGGVATLATTKSAAAHGLVVWFDTELVEGIGFSTGPNGGVRTYGQLFLPFAQPVQVAPAQTVEVDLSASLVGGDYVWRWSVTGPGIQLEQSSFLGEVINPDAVARRHPDARPQLDVAGQADAFILSRMDGAATVSELAADAFAAFPGHFADFDAALARVGDFAVRYAARR